jgi:hypothetical protein
MTRSKLHEVEAAELNLSIEGSVQRAVTQAAVEDFEFPLRTPVGRMAD